MRHAEAKNVVVELSKENFELRLRVRDDGKGFDVHQATTKAVQGTSMGLMSMKERTSLLSGVLTLQSVPERFTEVEATFPLGKD